MDVPARSVQSTSATAVVAVLVPVATSCSRPCSCPFVSIDWAFRGRGANVEEGVGTADTPPAVRKKYGSYEELNGPDKDGSPLEHKNMFLMQMFFLDMVMLERLLVVTMMLM